MHCLHVDTYLCYRRPNMYWCDYCTISFQVRLCEVIEFNSIQCNSFYPVFTNQAMRCYTTFEDDCTSVHTVHRSMIPIGDTVARLCHELREIRWAIYPTHSIFSRYRRSCSQHLRAIPSLHSNQY